MTALPCSETCSPAKIGPEAAISRFLESFHSDQTLGVAVSGGSDSTGLLVALSQLTAPDRLVALTVDHGLRSGSRDEAMDVGRLCQTLGVRHEILHWQGDKPATGIQAAARDARYRLLSDAADKFQLGAIVTAHTANDQAETLVMRRKRMVDDEGWGLAGIPPATLYGEAVWFVRPLLGVGRAAIRSFLQRNDIGWANDPSNEDARFERVRVRKADPVFEQTLGSIWQARTDWSHSVAETLSAKASRTEDDCFSLETDGLSEVMLQAALAVLIDVAGGRARGLDRNGRERLKEFVSTSAPLTITVGRAVVSRKAGRIELQRERRNVARIDLVPGEVVVWDGRFQISCPATARNVGLTIEVGGDQTSGILPESHVSNSNETGILAQRLCGRASRLLPVFELEQADVVARMCGRDPFPACPWKNWMISASD